MPHSLCQKSTWAQQGDQALPHGLTWAAKRTNKGTQGTTQREETRQAARKDREPVVESQDKYSRRFEEPASREPKPPTDSSLVLIVPLLLAVFFLDCVCAPLRFSLSPLLFLSLERKDKL